MSCEGGGLLRGRIRSGGGWGDPSSPQQHAVGQVADHVDVFVDLAVVTRFDQFAAAIKGRGRVLWVGPIVTAAAAFEVGADEQVPASARDQPDQAIRPLVKCVVGQSDWCFNHSCISRVVMRRSLEASFNLINIFSCESLTNPSPSSCSGRSCPLQAATKILNPFSIYFHTLIGVSKHTDSSL